MIRRYTLAPMDTITSDWYKIRTWCQVETAAAEAQGAPPAVISILKGNSLCKPPHPTEVSQMEKVTGHDVAAFLKVWDDRLPDVARPWLHRGMTSSDLVDTANSLLIRDAGKAISEGAYALFDVAASQAEVYRRTVRVGRTHGQHAEITTWGHWLAVFALAAHRACQRLDLAFTSVSRAKLSGPVGDYKKNTPLVENKFAQLLGLRVSGVGGATQVVHRDTYADVVWACSQLATLIESLALEIRLGQQTEIAELFEPRPGSDPVGSSAMPHKRNPITSEQLCGLARLVRSYVLPVQEGIPLWHERDISHSSVERVALWDALTLTHYMVFYAFQLLRDLEVDQERMESNAYDGTNGRILSSAARSWLVEEIGLGSQESWDIVAEASNRDDDMVEAVIKTASAWPLPKGSDPDWSRFREAMQADQQVSPNDDRTFSYLNTVRRVVANRRKENSQ